MIARARVVLGGAHLTSSERAAGGLAPLERAEIVGTPAPDWEAAKRACPIPEGALILYWMSDE